LIKARIQTLLPSTGTFVPGLNSVHLEEKQQDGTRNLVAVDFSVLLKKQDGTTEPLPGRNYTLRVEIYPQLINSTTMPDAALRKSLLQCGNDPACGNNGVILNFYYFELDGGPNFIGGKVDCHNNNYDVIDEGVMTGAYQVSSLWAPIPIPLDGALQFVTDVTQIPLNLIGVDLGTQQDLKLALQLDKGSSSTFDPTFTQFSHFPDNDWLLDVDKSLLSSYVSSNISTRETQLDPSITPTTPSISFTQGGILVDGGGSKTIGNCGSVPFTFEYSALPKVCKRNGNSVVSMCVYTNRPPTPKYANGGQEACVGVTTFFQGLFSQGLADAVVSTPCQEKKELNLQLSNDSLYVTKVDLDNQFLVIGRSQLMDVSSTGRVPAPQSCP
jgi:hypothetical protein